MRSLLIFAALLSFPVMAQTAPEYSGNVGVIDAANIIPDDEERVINERLQKLGDDTKHSVVVLTAPDLQGYPIEEYSNAVFRQYSLGSKERNDGVLLVLAPNEAKGHRGPRIEVGYGLEGTLTDAASSQIIHSMTPMLKNGNIAGAVAGAVDQIGSVISEEKVTPQQLVASSARRKDTGSWGWLVFLSLAVFVGMAWFLISRIRGVASRRQTEYEEQIAAQYQREKARDRSASHVSPRRPGRPMATSSNSGRSSPAHKTKSSYSPPSYTSSSYDDDSRRSSSSSSDYGSSSSSSSSSSSDWGFSDGGSSGGGGSSGSDW